MKYVRSKNFCDIRSISCSYGDRFSRVQGFFKFGECLVHVSIRSIRLRKNGNVDKFVL